jgi:hypothetical protein
MLKFKGTPSLKFNKTFFCGMLVEFAKPVQALQHLAYKLAPRYNQITDFSAPLEIDSGH